ncbi:MAG: class I SAM-dependent methyltransferase [Gammaproteobacteria bacterium]|nr:class I SAM-dependent methyltransferase [Gammaproteobacteria bacterium]NNJ50068.1 class I SAM-dependent methyltransferase [Gammaproteobacteria bacterium]
MWNQRYSSESYAYGKRANDFLVSMIDRLPTGKILCLAEGEGRNAVWLAEQGNDVTAVDASVVGLQKANSLANARGVEITTVHADLADYDIGKQQWDAIISIFCHLPAGLRQDVHHRCIAGLRDDGMILLEAYTPSQLEYKTGGPPVAEMMMDADSLSSELDGLEFLHLRECVRDIHEGEFHNGTGAVVQLLAKR